MSKIVSIASPDYASLWYNHFYSFSERVIMPLNLRFFWTETGIYTVLVFLIALGMLVFLSQHLRHTVVLHFDQSILAWFHSIRSSPLTHFFSTLTWMGSLWVLLPLYILLSILITPHIHHFEKILGITFWGSVLSVYAIKYTLERSRPHFFGPINELPIDPSFPSAHTAQITAFALGISLAFYHSEGWNQGVGLSFLLIFLVVSVAASRMYLQVHYPSDIFAGLLVALMWSIFALGVVKSGVLK